MAYEVPEGLRRIARQLRDTTEEHARDASAEFRDRRDETRRELARLWSQIEEVVDRRLRPAGRSAARDMRHYVDDGRVAAVDALDRLRAVTRQHPMAAIGIAVAATWVVTSLLRRR